MRTRVQWNPALDLRLKALRAAGLTWDALAVEMGVGRNAALERGRRIGARKPQAPRPPVVEAADRPARPAGHPASWGLITAGTVLEGSPYPYPVFV